MTATASKQLAYQLRLFGIHASLERSALEAESSSLAPCEYLALLLEDEANYRKQIVAKRLKNKASFGREAELEEWDQGHDRGVTKAKLRELASLGFHADKKNLILLGRTGEGWAPPEKRILRSLSATDFARRGFRSHSTRRAYCSKKSRLRGWRENTSPS